MLPHHGSGGHCLLEFGICQSHTGLQTQGPLTLAKLLGQGRKKQVVTGQWAWRTRIWGFPSFSQGIKEKSGPEWAHCCDEFVLRDQASWRRAGPGE